MRVLTSLILIAGLSAPAFAQGTVAQRVACTGDAFRFCSASIPNVPDIIVCMKANFASLSPGCQAQFKAPAPARGRRQSDAR